jgi:hypothetical protein
MEKVFAVSLNNSAKYITEITDKGKKGHHLTFQKRIIEGETK